MLGVVLIKGGNHKLVVGLGPPHSAQDRQRVNEDIRTFTRVYVESKRGLSAARVKYLSLDELNF